MGLLVGSLGTIALWSLRGGGDVGLLDGTRDDGGGPLPDGPSYAWPSVMPTAARRTPGPALSPAAVAPGTTARTQYVEGRVGERLASGPWALTVDRVTRRRTEDRSALPPRPMVLVIVDLTLENLGDSPTRYTWLSFRVVDARGREFSLNPAALPDPLGRHPLIGIDSVGPQQQMAGPLGFPVEADAEQVALVYRPFVGHESFVPIRVALD